MMRVIFAHGLEGHPEGTKASYLRANDVDLVAPDCQRLPLAERVVRVSAVLDANPGAMLVGSSYGGLVSTWLATQRPLPGLLLLAPALHWVEPPVTDPDALHIPPSTPTIVIHGTQDTVVPIHTSRRLVGRCPHVDLREVDDDHRLSGSLEAILAAVRELGG